MINADLTFEITNSCNFKCKMCNIWKEKDIKFLDLEKIKEVIYISKKKYGSVESVTLTGGECFIHPRIDKVISMLCNMKLEGTIGDFDFVSNGWFTEKFKKVFLDNKDLFSKVSFGVGFSVDGLRDTHDNQRGMPGSFDRILDLISFLKSEFPNVSPVFKFTGTNINYKDLLPLHSFTHENNIPFSPKIAEFGLSTYYHRLDDSLGVDSHREEVISSLKDSFKTILDNPDSDCDKNSIIQIVNFLETGKHNSLPCFTPLKSLFVNAKGDIYPCLYDSSIGNIGDDKWFDSILSLEHKKIIMKGKNKDCVGCLAYHGFLKSYNYPKNSLMEVTTFDSSSVVKNGDVGK